jgi:hypothetical protein
MLSIGGVGLISALVIRASGCDDLNEAINMWREWTPRKRREVEDFFGIQPKSMQHEDVKATAHMTEDAEWEYIKKKYIPELSESDADGGSANLVHDLFYKVFECRLRLFREKFLNCSNCLQRAEF